MAHRMLFFLSQLSTLDQRKPLFPIACGGAGGIEAKHEQASFSLAVPGPLGGGRAFSFAELNYFDTNKELRLPGIA
jgi:hypothetical protein